MSLNPLTLLEKAISEHGSSVILGQRLDLVKEMLTKVQKEKSDLEDEVSTLRKEVEELKKRLPKPNFTEYKGAKFKRKPSGGYESSVYCPVCEVGMATISGADVPVVCGRCNALTTFCSHELRSVLSEVLAEYP